MDPPLDARRCSVSAASNVPQFHATIANNAGDLVARQNAIIGQSMTVEEPRPMP